MSADQSKKKLIARGTLLILLIGILIGGAVAGVAVWTLKPSTQLSASPTTSSASVSTSAALAEVAQVPQTVAKAVLTPQGWDTQWSQKLDLKLLAQFDSSGPPAWDAAKHPLVYISTNGPGYGGFLSGIKSPGIVIIDANTYEVILTKQYTLEGVTEYFEPHGTGASMDGKWIYLSTGDGKAPSRDVAGRLLVIDSKTLKLHQIIQTSSMPHHIKAFKLYDGRDVVLAYTFNWQAPGFGVSPGSGVWIMDPNDNNRIIGGIRSEQLQGNPYLAFPHPDGRHLFIGMPPGPIGDPDITHKLEGTVAVVDMKTWDPVKYYKAGFDPIWTTFTADGKYAFISDGGSDEIIKVDNEAQKPVATSRSAVHGNYGIALDWEEKQLFVVEKGESSHNRGKLLGLVDPIAMRPIDSFVTGGIRADHALVHPDPQKNELWISYNSNFREVVFDMAKKEVKTTIKHSGSSHNGAFVKYTALSNGEWQGELLSDQAGLHNSALAEKQKMLGVKEIIYGKERIPVGVTATSSATNSKETTATAQPQPATTGQTKSFTVKLTSKGFDGLPANQWSIKVKKGDQVKLTVVYADEGGDQHPLLLTGYNVYLPSLSPKNQQVDAVFTASDTGTFALICLNPDCKPHPNLAGKIIVEA